MSETVRSRTRVAQAARTAVAAGTSWLSLLAATSLGVPSAETTTTEIRAEGAKLSRGPMRLVVQTYAENANGRHARPSSSTQRPVTADELRRGVHVDLIDLSGTSTNAGRVVAWVEPGTANLEYDGGRARPSEKSMVGTALKSEGRVRIVLRKAAPKSEQAALENVAKLDAGKAPPGQAVVARAGDAGRKLFSDFTRRSKSRRAASSTSRPPKRASR